MFSFHNLREPPWDQVCDKGTVEANETTEWSQSDDFEKRGDFVRLLNHCFTERVWHHDLLWHPHLKFYYFRATKVLETRRIHYSSLAQESSRAVFERYVRKDDPKRVAYYRHMAFKGQFARYGQDWFFEITPTYHYTTDGREDYRFREDQLSGIKRMERNKAVMYQVHFLADYLRRDATLYIAGYPFLEFGELEKFQIDRGINDPLWLKAEHEDEVRAAHNTGDEGLF
jgi:hypothetical protein